jgi:hypothetical protein
VNKPENGYFKYITRHSISQISLYNTTCHNNDTSHINVTHLERVVGGEVDIQKKYTTSVGGVAGAHQCGLPVEDVLAVHRARATIAGRLFLQISKLLGDTFQSHETIRRGRVRYLVARYHRAGKSTYEYDKRWLVFVQEQSVKKVKGSRADHATN